MKVTIYSPDRHIVYDGQTPDITGVGGGVTARVRIAASLAAIGCQVSVICNCNREKVIDGVRYLPLDSSSAIRSDVLILHTTGGDQDLRPVLGLELDVRLRIVFVGGTRAPLGLLQVAPSAIYAPSNFIQSVIHSGWNCQESTVFVTHHGVNRQWHFPWLRPARSPFRLIYASHPSKGFEAASGILQTLRAIDPRFEMRVYGGNRLWGGDNDALALTPGCAFGGLIGQKELQDQYARSSFAIHLQTRQEPFGLTLIESMAAGAIVLASPVGAFPELIRNGETGLLVDGDPADADTWHKSANLILGLASDSTRRRKISEKARSSPLSWKTVALTWHQHWSLMLGRRSQLPKFVRSRCPACASEQFRFADGIHCSGCGRFGYADGEGLP